MTIIKIFLASSCELKKDREQIEKLLSRRNKLKIWKKEGITLELVIWEDFIDTVSQTRKQDDYNKAILDSDIFLMLFNNKVGKYTEEEFDMAYQSFHANKKPDIYTYFCSNKKDALKSNRSDLQSLWAFQEKLEKLDHFVSEYTNSADLQLKFYQQLDLWLGNKDFSNQIKPSIQKLAQSEHPVPKPKAEFWVAQLDKNSQAKHIVDPLPKLCCLQHGKTYGYILAGPSTEWPQAIRFKLVKALQDNNLDDKTKLPKDCKLTAQISETCPEIYLYKLFSLALTCPADSESIKTRLALKSECQIFYRELLSDEYNNQEFLVKILEAWFNLKLEDKSPGHFLLLIHVSTEKACLTWREQTAELLDQKNLVHCLLPPLISPRMSSDVEDWLKLHIEEEHREQIKKLIEEIFPDKDIIPHAELKQVLLPLIEQLSY